MTLYYHKDSYELKDIDDTLYNEWVSNSNPKASAYVLAPEKPSADAFWNNGEWIVPSPYVPDTVSARQIRLWLLQNGISLQMVTDAILAIADPVLRDSVSIEWEYAPYIERNHPMLVPLAQSLGLTEADIDRAFTEAYTL